MRLGKEVLGLHVFCASRGDRPLLSVIQLEARDGHVVARACNGHIAVRVEVPADEPPPWKYAYLEAAVAASMLHHEPAWHADDAVGIAPGWVVDGSLVTCDTVAVRLSHDVPGGGDYPNVDSVWPKNVADDAPCVPVVLSGAYIHKLVDYANMIAYGGAGWAVRAFDPQGPVMLTLQYQPPVRGILMPMRSGSGKMAL